MKKICILFVLCLVTLSIHANRIYVTQSGSGSMTGSSWSSAASAVDLQPLLQAANPLDTFWIAEGIYYTKQAAYSSTLDYSISFNINDIALYGGFAGTETAINQRSITSHPTVLSGDIGADGIRTNNSRHVITVSGSATIDGFTIQDGYADNSVISNTDTNYSAVCNTTYYGVGGGLYMYAPGHDTVYNSSGQDYFEILGSTHHNLTVKNCVFKNNYARAGNFGGGAVALFAVWRNYTNALFDNCKFINDTALYNGGAIWASASYAFEPCFQTVVTPDSSHGDLRLTIKNSSFDTCIAVNANGGAININGQCAYGNSYPSVKLYVDSSGFAGNMAGGDDGAISASVNPFQFSANIKSGLDTMQITNSYFTNNASSNHKTVIGFHGGVDTLGICNVVIKNTNFSGNTNSTDGVFYSDVYNTALKLRVSKSVFTNNAAVLKIERVGNNGLLSSKRSRVVVDSCNFLNNINIDNNGGGIFYFKNNHATDSVVINNVVFKNNHTSGALINVLPNHFPFKLLNATLDSNDVDDASTGIVYCSPLSTSWLTVKNTKFTNNRATAIHLYNYLLANTDSVTCSINECVFKNNTADNGAGMSVHSSSVNAKTKLTIFNSSFTGNIATYVGGAIAIGVGEAGSYSPKYDVTVENVLLSGNKAGSTVLNSGAAIYANTVGSYNIKINNSTIAANLGGAAITAFHPTFTLNNSIVWGNRANSGGALRSSQYVGVAGITANYCLFENDSNTLYSTLNTVVQNNCNYANPLFVAPDSAAHAPSVAGNYHIQQCSPALNTGNNSYISTNKDLDNTTRIQQTTVDLGAYESGHASFPLPLVSVGPASPVICAGSFVHFTAASVYGGAHPTYQWKVNNINVGTNSSSFITNTISDNDTVTCQLTSDTTCIQTIVSNAYIVTVDTLPPAAITTPDSVICYGSSAVLTATGGTTYSWGNGLGTGSVKTVSPTSTTTYIVTVTGANTCTAGAAKTVVVIPVIDTSVTVNNHTLTANSTSATYQWINCTNGDSAVIGATLQSFTVLEDGDYAVVVTKGNCSDTSSCHRITTLTTDVQQYGNNPEIRVYPNPVSNSITIQSSDKIRRVSVFNMLGALMQEENENAFSVQQLAAGVYTFKVTTANGNAIIRVVKE